MKCRNCGAKLPKKSSSSQIFFTCAGCGAVEEIHDTPLWFQKLMKLWVLGSVYWFIGYGVLIVLALLLFLFLAASGAI